MYRVVSFMYEFSIYSLLQTAGWTKMPLGTEVGLGPGNFVFDGYQLPTEKNGTAPAQLLAHVYCGQTVDECHLVRRR